MSEALNNNSKEYKDSEIKQDSENVSNTDAPSSDRISGDNEIISSLKQHSVILNEIKAMIKDRLEYDEVKEKAFDKLYEEMKRQKETSELLDRVVKPILSDLILFFDGMKKYEASLVNQSMNGEETLQQFRDIIEEFLEVLYRQEVIPMEGNISEIFNSKFQKAIKTENAENKEDDFKVVEIVRNGFTWRDKILRNQEVVVKRFINKE